VGTSGDPLPATLGVCHIASGDRWAGAEVQIATLLKYLARDPGLHICAIVLNPGRLAEEIEQVGIPTRVIPEGEKGFREMVREAARFLKDRNVQIIHSHRYKENLLGAWVGRRCNVPHIIRTQHGLPEPHTGFRALRQGLIRTVDNLVMRFATDRVVSVSFEITAHLTQRIKPQKVVTIPNGVDLERMHSGLTTSQAKERLGIEHDCQVIGIAGRLEPIKRLDIFLEVAKIIAARRPTARFVISGEGREKPSLVKLARSLGIGDRVLFLGHRNDMYDVLRAFDVLLLCSDHEGLPTVLLEALSLGVVVVARAVGGIPEVVRDGVNGILVDSSDPRRVAEACVQALVDRPGSERLVESGIRCVKERHDGAEVARQVSRLYRSL
jgi:glycosyltransferase involved in cell wall biosynthesis